jgi:hypothetical protein
MEDTFVDFEGEEKSAEPVTISDIFNTNCGDKHKFIEDHLYIIFKDFTTKRGLVYNVLNSEGEYALLCQLCKHKSPDQIKKILSGKGDIEPTVLKAQYADKFVNYICQYVSGSEHYKYIHAIAPFIYDVWNSKLTNTVFLCYYKQFGDLVKCPTSSFDLYSLWNGILKM